MRDHLCIAHNTGPTAFNAAATSRVPARAALVGNPSDGYGGAVLGLTIPNVFADVGVVVRAGRDSVDADAVALVEAATQVAVDSGWPVPSELDWFVDTSIPREVGLSGSSAIVLGALESLAQLVGVDFEPDVFAAMALAAETDVLGWRAGLQDRVLQAFDRPMLMDFAPEMMTEKDGWPVGRYTPIDPTLLPSTLFVAFSEALGEPSHVTHGRPTERGDQVYAVMEDSGELARLAVSFLEVGDMEAFGNTMSDSFRNRCAVLGVPRAQVELVEAYDSLEQVAANSAGSGGAAIGAIVGPDTDRVVDTVRSVAESAGHRLIIWSPKPT